MGSWHELFDSMAVVLFIVFVGLLFVSYARYLLLKVESRRLRNQIRDIRKNSHVTSLKSASGLFDRELLGEINLLIEDLLQERKKLYQDEESIKEIVTGISHDFRTPLTSISGYVQILLEQNSRSTPEEREKYLQIIDGRSRSLAALVEDFYTYSSLSSFDIKPKLENNNPLTALRAVLANYYEELENRFAQVQLNIPEEAYLASLDRVYLERAFGNLVRNALNHGKDFFAVGVRSKDEYIEIVIRNGLPDGLKLDKEQVQKFFERNFSVNWAKGATSTGLGLPIARTLLEQLGGSLTAEADEHSVSMICAIPLLPLEETTSASLETK